MSQLINLRRKIKSIKTIRKITYAMRLISMSLYSKLEKTNPAINYYQKTITSIFGKYISIIPEWENPILFPKDILNSHPLIIISASTKGFCAGFNTELFKYFKRVFFIESHQTPTFITIGRKAAEFVKEEKLGKILQSFDTLNTNNYLFITDEILKIIHNNAIPFSSISTFSNSFKNFFNQKPQKTIITPINIEAIYKPQDHPAEKDESLIIWEGNKQTLMNSLGILYLRSSILNILFNSLLSEQSSRFLAMDNATSNADKFLEKLTLDYNKSRQTLITKELLELVSSFASVN